MHSSKILFGKFGLENFLLENARPSIPEVFRCPIRSAPSSSSPRGSACPRPSSGRACPREPPAGARGKRLLLLLLRFRCGKFLEPKHKCMNLHVKTKHRFSPRHPWEYHDAPRYFAKCYVYVVWYVILEEGAGIPTPPHDPDRPRSEVDLRKQNCRGA